MTLTQDKTRKHAIRARMAATGEPYSVAARNLDTPLPTPVAVLVPQDVSSVDALCSVILGVWDSEPEVEPTYRQFREAGGTERVWLHAVEAARAARAAAGDTSAVEELGVRALPADATPAARARAEANWYPMPSDLTCRCSGPCYHGRACSDGDEHGACEGRMVHEGRFPAGLLSGFTEWSDIYECDTCGERGEVHGVEVPGVAWGEKTSDNGSRCYPDVRHPSFKDHPGQAPAGDGTCRGCGGYALEGLLCDQCRAEGLTDDGDWDDPHPGERAADDAAAQAGLPAGTVTVSVAMVAQPGPSVLLVADDAGRWGLPSRTAHGPGVVSRGVALEVLRDTAGVQLPLGAYDRNVGDPSRVVFIAIVDTRWGPLRDRARWVPVAELADMSSLSVADRDALAVAEPALEGLRDQP